MQFSKICLCIYAVAGKEMKVAVELIAGVCVANAHTGLGTELPVWAQYQLPLGCPDSNSTAEYNTSVGLGAYSLRGIN